MSVSAKKISEVDNIPRQGVLLEVLGTDDQTFAVVPTLHISTNRKAHHKNIPHQHDFQEVVEVPMLNISVSMRI